MRKNKYITFIFLYLITMASFAEETPHRIGVGLVNEFYPSADPYFEGSAPQSQGVILSYTYDETENKDWTNLRTYYISVDTHFKYENQPELYDSDRGPYSNETNLKLIIPVLDHGINFAANFITGLTSEMNGPQVNDKFNLLHAGVQLEKLVPTDDGSFKFSATAAYARYFYEIDDEPALEQTNTPRESLAHSGTGPYLEAKIEYNKKSNKVRVIYSELQANDEEQKLGDYKRKKFVVSWTYEVNKSTDCGLEFSITEHEYKPIALQYKDAHHVTKALCEYKIN